MMLLGIFLSVFFVYYILTYRHEFGVVRINRLIQNTVTGIAVSISVLASVPYVFAEGMSAAAAKLFGEHILCGCLFATFLFRLEVFRQILCKRPLAGVPEVLVYNLRNYILRNLCIYPFGFIYTSSLFIQYFVGCRLTALVL